MAHDQRYCLGCGARRGPLPTHVAALIGSIREQGPPAAADAPLVDSVADLGTRPPRLEFALPGPRAAAAAVMGMLGFGVIVGSLVGGTSVAQLANAPLIVVGLNHPAHIASVGTDVTEQETQSAAAAAPAPGVTQAAAAQAPTAPAASPSTSSPPPSDTSTAPAAGFGGLPPVKHVFLILLSDRGFAHSFGGKSGYLSGALRRQGELVQNYYAVAASPLANELALISGQGPTPQTAGDCPVFTPVHPGRKGPRGQVLGTGCVYPAATNTLANQLTTAGHTWKAYIGGIPNDARTACRVPHTGSKQPQMARGRTAYLAWRNPFLYFRSLTAGGACRQSEVPVGRLAKDVKNTTTAPSLAYIVPPACEDGSEASCKPGAPAGLTAANRFLKLVVPLIKRSAAYKDGGLIAVTFDQAPQTGADADSSACCGSPASYPNLRKLTVPPAPPPAAVGTTETSTAVTGTTTTTATTTPAPSLGVGATAPTGGGGQVGLLLISGYVKPGSTDVIDYFNHFSLLGSIENLFGLHRLGYAGAPALPLFGAGVFNHFAG